MNWIHNERLRRATIWVILPLIVYLITALIITWPLPRHLTTHAAGVGYGDTYMNLRQAWEAKEQLIRGHNPVHQTRIAYPDGITSRMMWSTPLRWVPTMLLMLVFEPLTAFNLWLIATLVLNGLTAYWLGMALSERHVPAALLGGLVFTAFPNMQGHLSVGHIDVLAMYGLPLFALAWWRVLFIRCDPVGAGFQTCPNQDAATPGAAEHRPEVARPYDNGWRVVIGGGFALALACLGLTSQIIYNVMPIVLFTGLYALIWQRDALFPRGAVWHTWPAIRAAAMIAWGGAILLIFFGPLLTDAGRAEIDQLKETGRVTFSMDLLAVVSPSPYGPLEDRDLVPDYARDVLGTNSAEGAAYVGIVALALVLIGVVTCKAARPWLWVALGALLFALGPLLKWRDDPVVFRVENIESYVTLPWAALQDLPVLKDTRTPGRFGGAVALAWGALVSIGAGVALRRVRWQAVQFVVAVLLGVVILLEYQLFWPYSTGSADQGDHFVQLAQMDDVEAVYNYPALNPTAQMQAMYQQTIHGKPMVAGQLYRLSPQDPALLHVIDAAIDGTAVAIVAPEPKPTAMPEEVLPHLLNVAGADRLIVHKRFVPDAAELIARLRNILGDPEFEDDWHAAFVVPESSALQEELILLVPAQDEWRAAGPTIPTGTVEHFSVFGDQGTWYVYTTAPSNQLWYRLVHNHVDQRLIVYLDDRVMWAGDVRYGYAILRFWERPGFHTLRFETLDGCDPYPFEAVCFGAEVDTLCEHVDPPLCISAGVAPWEWLPREKYIGDGSPQVLEVQLDHGVRLRGYNLAFRDDGTDRVSVELFWGADHALPESYALFVHVADPVTGVPAAQYTGFPALLTNEWDGGADWVSSVSVNIEDLPPGEYAINVGWFIPETGERLGVYGDYPWAGADMIHLGTIEVP